jgi:hypothetical protein
MANDPDRYAALVKDWNMGPFYVLVDGNTGDVQHEREIGILDLHRASKVSAYFFEDAKAKNLIVRIATIQLVGPEVTA